MKSMLDYVKLEQKINNQILSGNNLESFKHDYTAAFRDIVIFATGSSSNAATAARLYLQKITNMPVYVKEPSIVMNYEDIQTKDTLYFAISQGGHSSSTINLVDRLQKDGFVVWTLTSKPESPIAKIANNVIDLNMGIEEMPYVTAGYVATILNLFLLALLIAENNGSLSADEVSSEREKIEKVVQKNSFIIEKTDEWFKKHKHHLVNNNRYVTISYGSTYGTAKEAETKFTETLHVAAHGHELEEYMHGPYLGLIEDDVLFLIDPDGKLKNRMKTLRQFLDQHMKRTYLITLGDEVQYDHDLAFDLDIDELLAPLVLTTPVHLISYYLSKEKGVDLTQSYYPDFDQITKSKI